MVNAMTDLSRRSFLTAPALLAAAPPARARVALVRSAHPKLAQPVPAEHPLDCPRVRDMTWRAIDYAGGLDQKIRPGSWVVVKPNLVHLYGRPAYRPGDVTDWRVTKAVLEYVAERTRARRITVAEGGSYRGLSDPATNSVLMQKGVRVDALTCDWGEDFPGFTGSLAGLLKELRQRHPERQFDYVDLSYDAVRDAAGAFRRLEVPRARNGVGAFGARPDYFVTNTILKCDFLINVPVMKVHTMCGLTACFKNYVGAAPRQCYAPPYAFSNLFLHEQHQVEGRLDPFIADLASFHPPDFNVVDGIRGLQYQEHNNRRPEQMLQNNLVLAGADTVAVDALVAYLMGFNVWDIDFLHLAAQREMGEMDLGRCELEGDDPDTARRRWGKPRNWHGRCNRTWLVSRDPAAEMRSWVRHATRGDTLDFVAWSGGPPAPETVYAAGVRVRSDGARKAVLWAGVSGRVTASLNGEQVLAEENLTRYRVGQFQKPLELRAGENQLVFRVEPRAGEARLSALLADPRNDGDSVEGIRWVI